MSLQTIVKAGNITNLSDARYFAGMGVEIIGFPIGKTDSISLESSKIKEIIGWLSGIKIALEFMEADFEKNVWLEIIEQLKPDYIQIPLVLKEEVEKITSLPLLLVTDALILNSGTDDNWILYTGTIASEKDRLKTFCAQNKVILSGNEIDASTVMDALKTFNPYGLELKGGNEISPGLKSFDEVSEILELLEVEE